MPDHTNMPELIYLASKRHAIALDPFTGDEVWSTKLPKVIGTYITLLNTPHTLFAARSNGYVYALNKYTGEILWEKLIKDLKNYPISVTTSIFTGSQDMSAVMAASAAQAAAAAAAAAG